MKRSTGRLLAVLLAALTLLASGCGEKQETPDGAPDKPLMQEEDLTVEPQPDANFTLELPDGFLSLGTDYEPNGETQDATYDSDGMLPYDFARHYDADARLVVGTDYYPETGREVISYLRADAVGVGTPRGVKVGDSEKALLTEYPEALYCIAADESELYDGYSDEGGYSEPAYDFDRAYVWQPQTPQDGGNYDVRDIAFYLKDGTVTAITMTKPYAFRFVYGVDRDAALRLAEENRAQILQGQTGGHLTELGISQAHKLGEKLADEVFDAVISSPLKRAVDTTNIVLGYGHENEIELCDLLKERDWGEYTLHSYAEARKLETLPPSVETLEQGMERGRQFANLMFKKYDGKKILCVGHGFINRCIMSMIYGVDKSEIRKMDNAEYRIVEMRGEIERTGAEGMKDEVSAN